MRQTPVGEERGRATREGCPVVHFDHHSAEHNADPVGSYRRLRSTTPVAWTEAHGGFWVLSDYASVFAAARDDDTFSSARTEHGGEGLAIIIPKAPTAFHIPIELDPPAFRPYRSIVNRLTAPMAKGSMDATTARYTTAFIDDIIETGECDLATVAGVPAAVTVDWLGLDASQYARYAAAMHTIVASHPQSPEYQHAKTVDIPWVEQQCREHIALRRREPTDDAVSFLLAADLDGRGLTDDEVYSIVELLISGGVGTTASLVTQALVWLADHHDVRARLIAEPELLDVAVEEFLRVFSPTQALARTVMADAEFQGCPLRRGDRALLSWASANRDGAHFEDPDRVDITRWPNRHMAFGVGIHRCAGSHLGRGMSRALIGQVLERMPDYEVDTARLVTYPDQGINAGYHSIPVRFTPGARRGPRLWDVPSAEAGQAHAGAGSRASSRIAS